VGADAAYLYRRANAGWALHAAPVAGPLASWDVAVPADARLLGFRRVVQAVLVGGRPSALTNSQDLVLGEYGPDAPAAGASDRHSLAIGGRRR